MKTFLAGWAVLLLTHSSQAAFLVEVDTDGANNGVVAFSPNFSFGGDTTTASTSVPSTAFGMTGGNSIFGGDGSAVADTYVVTYNPSTEPDNLVIPPGTDLGDGDVATGATGGGPGIYDVYATWPFTSNVSGGLINYTVDTAGDSFAIGIDQNNGGAGIGHVWINLGDIAYTSGDITVTQETSNNTFVSMRLAGVLFEAVPEPSSLVLAALGLLGMLARRGRRVGRPLRPSCLST